MASAFAEQVKKLAGVQGYWRLNETTGVTIKSSAGTTGNGTLGTHKGVEAPQEGEYKLAEPGFIVGDSEARSIRFVGSAEGEGGGDPKGYSAFITLPNQSGNTKLFSLKKEATWGACIQLDKTWIGEGREALVFACDNEENGVEGWGLEVMGILQPGTSPRQVGMYVFSTGKAGLVVTTFQMKHETPYFVVATYKGSEPEAERVKIYINGQKQATFIPSSGVYANYPGEEILYSTKAGEGPTIGAVAGNIPAGNRQIRGFNGRLGEIFATNKAITATEVESLATASGLTASLVPYVLVEPVPGAAVEWEAEKAYAERVTIAQSGVLTQASIFSTETVSGATSVRLAVFNEGSNKPGSLVVEAVYAGTPPQWGEWLTTAVSGAHRLYKGEKYWLAVLPLGGGAFLKAGPSAPSSGNVTPAKAKLLSEVVTWGGEPSSPAVRLEGEPLPLPTSPGVSNPTQRTGSA